MNEPHLNSRPAPICCIGASAGGLDSLERFLKTVTDPGLTSFIIMQHLSPDFESQMSDLLAHYTSLPVKRVRNGDSLEPATVYVTEPGFDTIVLNCRFRAAPVAVEESLKRPIDKLFRSVAYDAGRNAIACVLSGTGDDGMLGAEAVFDSGGYVVVQTPDDAAFAGMPTSVIENGKVHATLPVEDIWTHVSQRDAQAGNEDDAAGDQESRSYAEERTVALLRERFGTDFSNYKPTTFRRRIEHRRLADGFDSVDAYIQALSNEPARLERLYRDQLIGVTQFFRDSDAFLALRHALEQRADAMRQTFTVWVPGCATGEEAYTIAIMLRELADELDLDVQPRILATDVHPESLQSASRGIYAAAALNGVDERLLGKYFTLDGENCQVVDSLRSCVTFNCADVLVDEPPRDVDLVSCRNLLIYLKPLAQNRVLNLLHFALRPEGLLFLGKSETLGDLQVEFDTVDGPGRVYRKWRSAASVYSSASMLAQSVSPSRARDRREPYLDRLLERFVPRSFVVDAQFNLLHSFNDASSILSFRSGKNRQYLPDLMPDDYRAAVLSALVHARSRGESRQLVAAPAGDGTLEGRQLIEVSCLSEDSDEPEFLVSIQPAGNGTDDNAKDRASGSLHASEKRVSSLERQLAEAREDLQTTIEELETSNEELQATNEELIASNEELYSSNTELHSVNEQLQLVNVENQLRVKEVESLNERIELLLEETATGALYLDAELRIVQFTERVADLLGLHEQDVGRDFLPFASAFDVEEVDAALEAAITTGTTAEFEVSIAQKAVHLIRIVGLKRDAITSGCVVLFVDISRLHQEIGETSRLADIVKQAREAIISRDRDGNILSWNRGAEELLGYREEEVIGRHINLIVPPEQQHPDMTNTLSKLDSDEFTMEEVRRIAKDGTEKQVALTMFPVFDRDGDLVSISSIEYDLTEQKRAEQELIRLLDQREQFLALLSHEIRNPIMTLLSSSAILQTAGTDPRDQRRALESIDRQVKQLAALLEDLLDASRMRRDQLELRLAPVDFRDAIRSAVADSGDIAAERDVTISVVMPDARLPVQGDSTRLKQLVTNLLNNAIRYSSEGASVRCEASLEDDAVRLRVSDAGEGMTEETLARVFEPFFQADKHIGGPATMGLGLALVKSIVTGHGGEIAASSDGLGKGSTFEVCLPAIGADLIKQSNAVPAAMNGGTERRVFLVDDDEDGRSALSYLLKRRGHRVIEAANGEDALKALDNLDVDVAILDIGLPDISGLDVGRRIAEMSDERRPLLVALSGFGQSSDLKKSEQAGFDIHLVKPVDMSVLDEVIGGNAIGVEGTS